MPNVPFPFIPGGAYGYAATTDPEADQTTHAQVGGGGVSAALAPGHIFVGNSIGIASDVAMSGDASISSTGVLTLTNAGLSPSLASAHIYVGSSLGVATSRAMSGDGTISNTGVFTLANSGPGVAGPIGDATHVPQLSIDNQGRLTQLASISIAAGSMPAGGTTGQLIAKASNTNFDYTYVNAATLAVSGQSPAQEPVIGATTANVGSGSHAARNDHDHAYPILAGTGDPNGVVTAPANWLYVRLDGSSTTTRLYVNTNSGTVWAHFTASA